MGGGSSRSTSFSDYLIKYNKRSSGQVDVSDMFNDEISTEQGYHSSAYVVGCMEVKGDWQVCCRNSLLYPGIGASACQSHIKYIINYVS